MISLTEAAKMIEAFEGPSLRTSIAQLEKLFSGDSKAKCKSRLKKVLVDDNLLDAALVLKATAGQINVIVHAVGILLSLPHILEQDEVIEFLSLGAGNTGKDFDLETDRRIAEFKFIRWRGGSETIRKNQLFKDFYLLAEENTKKKKFLYVVEKEHPLKFLLGSRAIDSVFSRNVKLLDQFREKYQGQISVVSEYFALKHKDIEIVDLAEILPSYFKKTELVALPEEDIDL